MLKQVQEKLYDKAISPLRVVLLTRNRNSQTSPTRKEGAPVKKQDPLPCHCEEIFTDEAISY